jgi:hypothetical protein
MSVYAEYSLVIDHCLAIAFEVVFYACFGVIYVFFNLWVIVISYCFSALGVQPVCKK